MREYEKRDKEVESNSDFESVDMAIATEDMGFVFDIMFSQMYRDPIGSVIREITSNCFDSHIEAKVDDAVVITLGEDDGGDFISFKDVGIGISPDRMKNVYAKPAKSTKRDSNDFIGYWGLGSKSPLAYVEDGFHVDTISDGKLYNYFIHKGKKGPQITLVSTEETTEHNGTVVKIYFKRDGDKEEFDEKLEEQLRYFDNVYVIGSRNFNNNYKLHIGRHFKYRSDCDRVSLHLCIGKVTYPIDWEKLDIEQIHLPFGLKFGIGDLPVTPERESIKYTSIKIEGDEYVDTREIIKQKIELFKEEIQDLVGREPEYHNNFFDWRAAKDLIGTIKLFDKTFNVSAITEYPPQYYQPLHSVGLEPPDTAFFSQITIKRVLDTYHGSLMRNLFLKGQSRNLQVNNFDNSLIVREFEAVGKFKKIKLDYLRKLAKDQEFTQIKFVTIGEGGSYTHLKFPKSKRLDYSQWNRLKLYKYYKTLVLKELYLNSIDYKTLDIPAEWEEEWQRTNALNKEIIEAEDGEIIVDDVAYRVTEQRMKVTISSISEFDGFVLYGFEKDIELLNNFHAIFISGEFRDHKKIYKIRQRDEKLIVLLKNVIKVTSFMSDNPIFRKVATAAYINKSKLKDYDFFPSEQRNESISTYQIYSLIFHPLAEKWKDLLAKSDSTINLKSQEEKTQDFIKEILDLAITNNWLEGDIVQSVKKVEDYFKGLELFNYIVPNTKAVGAIANFVKLSGKPINREWDVLEPWQKELMEELQDKFIYLTKLSEDKTSIPYGWSSKRTTEMAKRRESNVKIVTYFKSNIKEIQIFKSYHNDKAKLGVKAN